MSYVTDDVDNNGQTGFPMESVALETRPVLLEVHSEALVLAAGAFIETAEP
jgi:hypothetical protein